MKGDVMSSSEDRNRFELFQMVLVALAIIILGTVVNECFPNLARILNYIWLAIAGIMAMPLIWMIGEIPSLISKKSAKV